MQIKTALMIIASFGSILVHGHARMIQPPSRNTKDPNGMTAVKRPCGEYPKGDIVATYTAGQTVNVKIDG